MGRATESKRSARRGIAPGTAPRSRWPRRRGRRCSARRGSESPRRSSRRGDGSAMMAVAAMRTTTKGRPKPPPEAAALLLRAAAASSRGLLRCRRTVVRCPPRRPRDSATYIRCTRACVYSRVHVLAIACAHAMQHSCERDRAPVPSLTIVVSLASPQHSSVSEESLFQKCIFRAFF